ncbi:hypothetical protein C4K88_03960 [Arthrobacter pityocampae]|uniref:Uncharacterized protein n=1 Tax=Arthrobacter pityocampae TaxID=547334 RepID=A0A2S5IZ72_9MICC|nr:hypothetical protein [Arthrobacter pityocampae]PPB49855.1 hypothetical protein C4K88_03960 [Arthrobacter pityocampae]
MESPRITEQRRRINIAIRTAELRPKIVWIRYFGLAGALGELEFDAYLHRAITIPQLQCDLIAHAVNELIDEIPPLPRAPYGADIEV